MEQNIEPLIPESRAIDIAKRAAKEKDEEHFSSPDVASKKLNKNVWIIEFRPSEAPLGVLELYVQVRVSAINGKVMQVYRYSR